MKPVTLHCGECGATFSPRENLPDECPHCGARVSAPRRQLREAELEDLARRPKFVNDPRRTHAADPRRSSPQ